MNTNWLRFVQMLVLGGSFCGLQQCLGAAVDYQISTMSTSVCTNLAATIERSRITTKTEAKHLITRTVYSSSINTSPNYNSTHSLK